MNEAEIIAKLKQALGRDPATAGHYDIESLYRRHLSDGFTPEIIHWLYQTIAANNPSEAEAAAFVAATHADIDALKILNDAGVLPSIVDEYKFTLLHAIAKLKMADYELRADDFRATIEWLLDNRVSVLKKDENENKCCFHYAARNANWRFINILRERGAKLDMIAAGGMTALHELADGFYINRYSTDEPKKPEDQKLVDDYLKTAAELIAGGVDLDAKDDAGNTAGDLAVRNRSARLLAALVPEPTVFQAIYVGAYELMPAAAVRGPNAICDWTWSLDGLTPLGAACLLVDDRAVEILLANGADPNAKDNNGRGALPNILRSRDNSKTKANVEKIIGAFVSAGWNKDGAEDEDGNTLLGVACKSGFMSPLGFEGIIVDRMIAIGANGNAANRNGQTPLMFACAGNFEKMESVQLALLEAGADVTLRDKTGRTALHYAAENRRDSAARALMDMLFSFGKPDPSAADNAGKTPLDIATENGNEETLKYLLSKV